MVAFQTLFTVLVVATGSLSAAPRVLVFLPKGGAALEPQVERSFSWAALTVVKPESVPHLFPPSPESRATAEAEGRADALLRSAEAAFVAFQFDVAAQRLEECEVAFDRLPPSIRHEPLFVRLQLLRGRVGKARKDSRAAAAFARAGEAAVEIDLDDAEYPPFVRQAFLAARARARARPAHSAEVTSEPSGAEVEVNGHLAGRTPAKLSLPPGRCFLSVTRAGFEPYLALCPSGPLLSVKLKPATRDGLRDQLRERLAADPAWFLETLLLETLAAEESARWIVVLDRDRAGGLKPLAFSAAARALEPLEPARFLETEIDKVSEAVRGLVLRAQMLEAQVVETPSGIPALQVRSGDLGLGPAVAFIRRTGGGDFLPLSLSPISAGHFAGSLPLSLASDGAWDVEYYFEARDRNGALICHAGEAAAPLRFRRTAAALAPPAWYGRWYVWTAAGIVAAGAAGAGVYFGTRTSDVSVTFGAHR